jgi:hypothetical protein
VTPALKAWIGHIFNHSISEPAWYWADDAEEWSGPREQIPVLIAETFESDGELLAGFSDGQLDQGFWYLVGDTRPEFMQTLTSETIPLEVRLRALKSFVPLFEQLMAVRCLSACYMWWDLLRFPLWDQRSDIQFSIIEILRGILAIPNDACRESALHGIGHLRGDCPEYETQISVIIDEFLAQNPDLRPELVAYAECARQGNVL